jgi:hypothetical protein
VRAPVVVCLGSLWLVGCSSGATGKLQLSWQLADGRSCADSGAASMALTRDGGAPQSYRCEEGLLPQAIILDAVPAGGVTLGLQALSTQAAPLYSGTLELDALPPSAVVTLYADKMR